MKSVLVTGGAGFIGSNLVARLIQDGVNVTVLDDLSTGRKENLKTVESRLKFIDGSICDDVSVADAVKGVDTIFHLAAIPSVPRSFQFPRETAEVNVDGTVRILVAAVENNVRRLVFVSSSSVYGDTPTLPKREDMPANPISPYGASKLAGEYYCRVFSPVRNLCDGKFNVSSDEKLLPENISNPEGNSFRANGVSKNNSLETVSVRFFNVYGPHQNPDSQYAAVIPIFTKKLLAGEPPIIYGDGEQTRDFTFVGDAVEGLMLSATAKDIVGEVINIAAGGTISVNKLAQVLAKIIGKDIKPIYKPARQGDILHSYADISKAARIIGYNPKTTL